MLQIHSTMEVVTGGGGDINTHMLTRVDYSKRSKKPVRMSALLTSDEISSSDLSGPFDLVERNNHVLIFFTRFIKRLLLQLWVPNV